RPRRSAGDPVRSRRGRGTRRRDRRGRDLPAAGPRHAHRGRAGRRRPARGAGTRAGGCRTDGTDGRFPRVPARQGDRRPALPVGTLHAGRAVRVGLAIWLVLPALLGLAATFTDYAPVEPSVHWVGLRNFAQILADRTFAGAARNIAIFSFVAVPLQLALGFGLAGLLRRPFRGRAAVRLLLALPWLVSPV